MTQQELFAKIQNLADEAREGGLSADQIIEELEEVALTLEDEERAGD
jgi:hypothetical protein